MVLRFGVCVNRPTAEPAKLRSIQIWYDVRGTITMNYLRPGGTMSEPPRPLPIPMFDGYIFDLDGTVYLGETLLPGAGAAITRLRADGRRVVFLSNNPTSTRAQY